MSIDAGIPPDGDPAMRNLLRAATRGGGRIGFAPPPSGDEGESDLWLISYADMMTLLFAVFVIVVSIVGLSPREERGSQAAAASGAPPGPLALKPLSEPLILGVPETSGFLAPRLDRAPPPFLGERSADPAGAPAPDGPVAGDALAGLRADAAVAVPPSAARYLQRIGLEGFARLGVRGDRVELAIDRRALFDPGPPRHLAGPEVGEDGRRVLARLYPLLAERGDLRIEAPGSAWAGAAARANAVARVLVDLGLPARALDMRVRLDSPDGDPDAAPLVLSWSGR